MVIIMLGTPKIWMRECKRIWTAQEKHPKHHGRIIQQRGLNTIGLQ